MSTNLKPGAMRVLKALTDAGENGCTTHALCQPDVGGLRFGARLGEIRAEGYTVKTKYLRPGSHLYVLNTDTAPAAVAVVEAGRLRPAAPSFETEGRRRASPRTTSPRALRSASTTTPVPTLFDPEAFQSTTKHGAAA
jgi:hypothetical protein